MNPLLKTGNPAEPRLLHPISAPGARREPGPVASKRAGPLKGTRKGYSDQTGIRPKCHRPREARGVALGALPAPSRGRDVLGKSTLLSMARREGQQSHSNTLLGKTLLLSVFVFPEKEGCGLKQQGLMQIISTSSPISQCNFLQENCIRHANITIRAIYNIPLTIRCQKWSYNGRQRR